MIQQKRSNHLRKGVGFIYNLIVAQYISISIKWIVYCYLSFFKYLSINHRDKAHQVAGANFVT